MALTVPDGVGLDISSGMVGLWTGFLSRWFRLPWVPLLGTGFKPRRSKHDSLVIVIHKSYSLYFGVN